MVGKRFDAHQQSWQIQWRCQGKHSLRVRLSAFNGDTVAAERVAGILQERIEAASDRTDRASFSVVLDELVAAELARHTHGGCVVSAAAGFIGSASSTSGDVAVVASDAAAGGVAAAGQSAGGDATEVVYDTPKKSLEHLKVANPLDLPSRPRPSDTDTTDHPPLLPLHPLPSP